MYRYVSLDLAFGSAPRLSCTSAHLRTRRLLHHARERLDTEGPGRRRAEPMKCSAAGGRLCRSLHSSTLLLCSYSCGTRGDIYLRTAVCRHHPLPPAKNTTSCRIHPKIPFHGKHPVTRGHTQSKRGYTFVTRGYPQLACKVPVSPRGARGP